MGGGGTEDVGHSVSKSNQTVRYSLFEQRFGFKANPSDANTLSAVRAHFGQFAREYKMALEQLQVAVETGIALLQPITTCEPVLMTGGHLTRVREVVGTLEGIRMRFVNDWMLAKECGYKNIPVDIRYYLR